MKRWIPSQIRAHAAVIEHPPIMAKEHPRLIRIHDIPETVILLVDWKISYPTYSDTKLDYCEHQDTRNRRQTQPFVRPS